MDDEQTRRAPEPRSAASDQVPVLYLEPDDEIPSVVRRLAAVHGDAAVLVAPGRSKATSSAVGLRLIARRASAAGISLALVADPASRILAAEAGIPAFASVAEALSGHPASDPEPAPRPRAAIHVVRGERPAAIASLAAPSAAAPAPAVAWSSDAGPGAAPGSVNRADVTQEVPVVAGPRPSGPTSGGRRGRTGRRWWAWGVGALVLAVALVAAVLPQAAITLVVHAEPIGPLTYTVSLPSSVDQGQLTSTLSAPATGTHTDTTPAKGEVTFRNYDAASHVVPKGTKVAAGDQVFTTDDGISVGPGVFTTGGIAPGTASVAVTAVTGGPAANVSANAISTVVTTEVADQLGGPFGYRSSLVRNAQPTSGGTSTTTPEITQGDVDGLVSRIDADLATKLQHTLSTGERVYAAPSAAQDPSVQVPANLVGTTGQDTFQLTGTLEYERRWVAVSDLRSAVLEAMHADTTGIPAGTTILNASVTISPTRVTVSGDQLQAAVSASGQVAPVTDESQLKARLSGKSRQQVKADLADIGSATVDFWPAWVTSVPQLPFRITITVETPSVTPLPTPTPTPMPTSTPTPTASSSGTLPSPSS